MPGKISCGLSVLKEDQGEERSDSITIYTLPSFSCASYSSWKVE